MSPEREREIEAIVSEVVKEAAEVGTPGAWADIGRRVVEAIQAEGFVFAHEDGRAVAGYLTSEATFESCGGRQKRLEPGCVVWVDTSVPNFEAAKREGLLSQETVDFIMRHVPNATPLTGGF